MSLFNYVVIDKPYLGEKTADTFRKEVGHCIVKCNKGGDYMKLCNKLTYHNSYFGEVKDKPVIVLIYAIPKCSLPLQKAKSLLEDILVLENRFGSFGT
eukprot:Pgem_evm1s13602